MRRLIYLLIAKNMGFGIYFQGKWAQACLSGEWVKNEVLSDITFL